MCMRGHVIGYVYEKICDWVCMCMSGRGCDQGMCMRDMRARGCD